MSIPKNLRTLKTNFEEADGLGIRQPKLNLCSIFLKYKKYNHAKKIVKIFRTNQSLVENQQCKYIWALKDRITIFSKSETIYD